MVISFSGGVFAAILSGICGSLHQAENLLQAVDVGRVNSPTSIELLANSDLVIGSRTGEIQFRNLEQRKTASYKFEVFDGLEDGLLCLTKEPQDTQWLVIARSLPEKFVRENRKFGLIRVSRFPYRNGSLNIEGEETVIEIETQRDTCCHVAGGGGIR